MRKRRRKRKRINTRCNGPEKPIDRKKVLLAVPSTKLWSVSRVSVASFKRIFFWNVVELASQWLKNEKVTYRKVRHC